MTQRLNRIFCLTILLPLLSGCILVDDFGGYFEKANKDACLEAVAKTLYADQTKAIDMENAVRFVDLEGQHFLLLRKTEAGKGGVMYRYRVQSGVYLSYRLDPSKRKGFLQEFPDAPVKVTEDKATIPVLNEETAKLLVAVANKPEYWLDDARVLYNPSMREDCPQEDRDLSKEK